MAHPLKLAIERNTFMGSSQLSSARRPRKGLRKERVALLSALLCTTVGISACESSGPVSSSSASSTGTATSARQTPSGDVTPAVAKVKVDPALRALLPASIRQAGAITVATDATYPSCEYKDSSGKIVGFEPDLWNAMGGLLGVKVSVLNTDLSGLIPGVQSGRYQFAMECLTDLVSREDTVDFVDFILDGTSTVLLKSGAAGITSAPLSVCGKSVALQSGNNLIGMIQDNVNPFCAKNGKSPVTVHLYPTNTAVLLALYAGRVDFTLQDSFAEPYLAESAPKSITSISNLAAYVPPVYCGIVVSKGQTQLRDALYAALQKLYADGVYADVMNYWNIAPADQMRPGVNLAKAKPLPAAA
jgi:polar amino acid transport system substrate-binding protein